MFPIDSESMRCGFCKVTITHNKAKLCGIFRLADKLGVPLQKSVVLRIASLQSHFPHKQAKLPKALRSLLPAQLVGDIPRP